MKRTLTVVAVLCSLSLACFATPATGADEKPAEKPAVKTPANPAPANTAEVKEKEKGKKRAKAKAEAEAKAKAAEAAKTEANPAAKPEAKPDAKPVAKVEAKPAPKPEAKPVKPDAKPAVAEAPKPEAKPEPKKPAKPVNTALLPSADKRYAVASVSEDPSFRRHVLPLMGRLGCNGRACHGSFQGQGGFMLSLFGYDFEKDHNALLKGNKDKQQDPRVTLGKSPAESLMIQKAVAKDEDEHGGGHRMDVGSWQYKLLTKWIADGAKNDAPEDCRFDHLEVQPEQFVFKKLGETFQIKVIAHWADGSKEDVTPLCRFRTNDESVAEISEAGVVKSVGKGDTHVVAFYDNGVAPVQTLLPVSELVGPKYPKVPTPTKIDELVVAKLKPLGIIPSDVATDAEFLRRVSLDITGTLPQPAEITAFLADKSADKRAKKIDELLTRPEYATWWATRLCDLTGNNSQQFNENNFSNTMAAQWYQWIRTRVQDNMPYDKIVEGLVLATSRDDGQSYEDFAAQQSQFFKAQEPADFTKEECMPYYWARRNMRTSNEKALGFSYAFLGVRLQCAECHKHPFDQWTQQDFQQFTVFFDRVQYGNKPEDRDATKKIMEEVLGMPADKKLANNERQKLEGAAVKDGKPIAWREVFVSNKAARPNRKEADKKVVSGRVITPKLLGDDEVSLQQFPDPREALMDWMRQKDNPYFARAFVNRVWASYFKVGIVDPPDDQNLANPPSNGPLLEYLTEGFIASKFDMKWLHREIANSRTYQLSWKPNESNKLDERNFSHSLIRRLPAEVAYDCLVQATASDKSLEEWRADSVQRATGLGGGSGGGRRDTDKAGYALSAFGKPLRVTNCDCERSDEPSLLQTMYLRNDGEMLSLIDRNNGWLSDTVKALTPKVAGGKPPVDPALVAGDLKDRKAKLSGEHDKLTRQLEKAKEEKDNKAIKRIETRLADIRTERKKIDEEAAKPIAKPEAKPENKPLATTVANAANFSKAVTDIYLRTVSRLPTADELARGQKYIAESPTVGEGLRDLLWAMLNTKEFIVNH